MVSMNKLDKLVSRIDKFCTQALLSFLLVKKAAPPQTWSMPDDPEEDDETPAPVGEDAGKYNELLHVAHEVRDPGLSSELVLLAELYKKAIEINGGYNSINRSIHNIINMYLEDEEDPQQEEIEDILNEVVSDLRKRAGGAAGLAKPDSPDAIRNLKQMKDDFNSQNLQQEVYDLSNYDETATSTFDPTGGVGKEEAGKGFGRGHSFTSRKSLKDWASHFENEKQRYQDLASTVKDAGTQSKINKLIEVLTKLKAGSIEENALVEAVTTSGDEQTNNQLAKVREQNKKLRTERSALKQSIRNIEINDRTNQLEDALKNTKDERTKELLKQQIELQKLRASKFVGKTEERNWRLLLIKSMEGGNWPSAETRQKMENKIQEGAAKKISMDKYWSEQAKENAKNRGKIEITEELQKKREEQGLGRYDESLKNVPNARNIDSIKLNGFIANLSQAMLAERKTAKDRLIGSKNTKVKAEEKAKFKPYLDEIAKASLAKDRASLLQAVRSLRTAIENEVKLLPEFNQYVISVRLSKSFHAFKEAMSVMDKGKMEDKESLSSPEANFISSTIQSGRKISTYFSGLEITSLTGSKYKNPYATQVTLVSKACDYMEGLLQSKPINDVKTASIERIVNMIRREERLKLAQTTTNMDVKSEQEAQNLADSVFDQLWDQSIDTEAAKVI